MVKAYSSEVCRQLAAMADDAGVLRPRRITRHEAGEVLELDLTGVSPAWKAHAAFELERYVGGGFAGQVYRAKLLRLEPDGGATAPVPLEVGGTYALKVFVPWSGFGRWFRDTLYGIGFQAPFGLQANPSAARACALWHKLIRRGAAVRLGSEQAVVDVHATFREPGLGSMGEVLEWIDGRVWRLEVNERLFAKKGETPAPDAAPPTEYAAKREFMRRLVGLFHEMGGPELARQYEWWTMKSQPNVLKRRGQGEDPAAGLVAVDFGAGLALLPVLPMSPADVRLIFWGLAAGRVVQFDRGDLARLESFVGSHPAEFADLGGALAELRVAEAGYHDAQLDVANHRLRVLTDGALRRNACKAWAEGYAVRGIMDAQKAERFSRRPVRTVLFVLLGLLPFFGRFLQRLWGNAVYRRHVARALTSPGYLARALRARQAEKLIDWHRRGRVSERRALALMRHPVVFWLQAMTLAVLPAGLHRFLTDRRYVAEVFRHAVVRPVKLYFNAALRRQWLCEMIAEGRSEGMLTAGETDLLLSQIDEPYIQKYLKALVVHLCTLFVSEATVGLLILYAIWFKASTWEEAMAYAVAIFVIVNASPVSPGAFVRGVYVVGLMIRERAWREYAVAAPISFLKMAGYLAFPIQMVWKYPVLARFMAARWATRGIQKVPVFGEHGALLEHGMFNLFFNVPISLRRRWRKWAGRNRAMARIGTVCGMGYLPGPSGTYASAITATAMAALFGVGCPWWVLLLVFLPLVPVGIVTAGATETYLGRKDPRPFVLDEVVGMMIAALAVWVPALLTRFSKTTGTDLAGWLPAGPEAWFNRLAWLPEDRWAWTSAALAFVWFRAFDILKPPPIRQLERLPGGWGIMADDMAAGAAAMVLTVATQVVLNRILG